MNDKQLKEKERLLQEEELTLWRKSKELEYKEQLAKSQQELFKIQYQITNLQHLNELLEIGLKKKLKQPDKHFEELLALKDEEIKRLYSLLDKCLDRLPTPNLLTLNNSKDVT